MRIGVPIQIAVIAAVILAGAAAQATAAQAVAQTAVKVESLVSPQPGANTMPRLLETFRVGKNV